MLGCVHRMDHIKTVSNPTSFGAVWSRATNDKGDVGAIEVLSLPLLRMVIQGTVTAVDVVSII